MNWQGYNEWPPQFKSVVYRNALRNLILYFTDIMLATFLFCSKEHLNFKSFWLVHELET